MSESASMQHGYDPEVASSRPANVVTRWGPTQKSLILYLMADQKNRNGTRKRPGRIPENGQEEAFSLQLHFLNSAKSPQTP